MQLQLRLEYLFDDAGLQLDPATVKSFWDDARSHGVPWALSVEDDIYRVPLKIFGDDARYGKKSGEQLYAIFLSSPLFRPRCARQSRWLLWSIRSSLFLGQGVCASILKDFESILSGVFLKFHSKPKLC